MEQRKKIIRLIEMVIANFESVSTDEEKMQTVNLIIQVLESIYSFVTVKTYNGLAERIVALSEEKDFEEIYKLLLDFKDDYVNNKTNKVKITFAIPTARAKYAKRAAEAILKYKGDEIEVVVSHNYSDEMTELNIVEIDDERFKYYRRENVEAAVGSPCFSYNLLNALSKSTGDYVFILSDKDIVDIDIIPHIIFAVQNNRDISALCYERGEQKHKQTGEYIVSKKGDNAILSAYIRFVMTGIIYKRSLLDIEYFYNRVAEKDYAYMTYTHVYILNHLCTQGNVIFFDDPGHMRPTEPGGYPISKHTYSYTVGPYGLPRRIIAFKSFVKLTCETLAKPESKIEFIEHLIIGYYNMSTISMHDVCSEQERGDINLVENATIFKDECEKFFREFFNNDRELLDAALKKLHEEYDCVLEKIDIYKREGVWGYEEY